MSFGDASTDGMGFRLTENNGPVARVGFLVLALPFMWLASFGDRDKNEVSIGHVRSGSPSTSSSRIAVGAR